MDAAKVSNLSDIRNKKYSIGVFDGKERTIVFDLNAFAQMEEMFGSMDAAQASLESGKMRDVRTMLWLGLIHDEAVLDPETGDPVSYNITPYQVGGWITTYNMKFIIDQLQNAITGAMPAEDTNLNASAVAAVTPGCDIPNATPPIQQVHPGIGRFTTT